MEHEVIAELRRGRAARRGGRRGQRAGGPAARRARARPLRTGASIQTPPSPDPKAPRQDLADGPPTATSSTLDAARPDAVARRHDRDRRTARREPRPTSSIPGTFVEYGPLMFAAQERRRSKQELIERTPADGLVGGRGRDRRRSGRGHVLRLHGAGRDAGHAQPPQEGSPVRARRAPPAAGGAVRRGRRRPARRRRHADRGRPGLPGVRTCSPVSAALVPAGRDRLGLLLRRQRGAARMLRRGDRHRGLERSAWAARR